MFARCRFANVPASVRGFRTRGKPKIAPSSACPHGISQPAGRLPAELNRGTAAGALVPGIHACRDGLQKNAGFQKIFIDKGWRIRIFSLGEILLLAMNCRPRSRAACVGVVAGLCGLLCSGPQAAADPPPYTSFTKVGNEYRLTLPTDPKFYYGFQHSDDLRRFSIKRMAMGSPGPTFGYTPTADEFRGFFRAKRISVAEPEDWDNDYMDDVWEIQHPYLNPLDPNDAFQPSPEPDAGGRNNLDYYRWKRGILALREVYSREASLFNFGAPTAAWEAVSREASVFNFGSPPANVEAISPELSVFNGEGGPPTSNLAEVYSREVSAFNFGSPPANVEALSPEVSVFNGEGPPTSGIAEVYSREVSTFNFGQPSAGVEAVSREVSVLNTAAP